MERKISVNTQLGNAVPEGFITKNKQRLKQYTNTVYLNNGDEFEIELFNPKQNKVLAKILMNGNSIGPGVVLRPGERVFLERFLNESKKFLFETYVVEGDHDLIEIAIAKNGNVVIEFYDEYVYTYYNTLKIGSYTVYGSDLNTFTTNSVGGSLYNTTTSYNGDNILTDQGIGYTTKKSLIKETGRVEKGSESNQNFTNDNTTFNYYPSSTNNWKILPMSTKPIVREDLVVYCTECGSKRKKDNHKFCPHCGTKY